MPSRACAALAVILALAAAAGLQSAPALAADQEKPQQNAADEAAARGSLEDAAKADDPGKLQAAEKKLEDAAVAAKQKSDAKEAGMNAGAAPPPR